MRIYGSAHKRKEESNHALCEKRKIQYPPPCSRRSWGQAPSSWRRSCCAAIRSRRTPWSAILAAGSGQGLTSAFLVKEYGFTVYAADLWSDPAENRAFFDAMGIDRSRIIPVKADAAALPFEMEFFDAVVSTDSYNYFGRDPQSLDEKLLPQARRLSFRYRS